MRLHKLEEGAFGAFIWKATERTLIPLHITDSMRPGVSSRELSGEPWVTRFSVESVSCLTLLIRLLSRILQFLLLGSVWLAYLATLYVVGTYRARRKGEEPTEETDTPTICEEHGVEFESHHTAPPHCPECYKDQDDYPEFDPPKNVKK